MRSVLLLAACILCLAAPVLAQEGGTGRGPWFPEEDFRKWIGIQQKLSEMFDLKDYKSGLEILDDELQVLLKVKDDLESGKTKLEHPQATEDQLMQAGLRDLTDKLASCWYNKACCLSKTGESAPAIEALEKSILLGFVDREHMRQDGDLDPIREEAGFKDAMGLMEYNDVVEVHVPDGLGEEPAGLLVVLHSIRSNEGNIIKGFSEFADERELILAAPRAPITTGPRRYEWKSYSAGKDSGLRKVAETIASVSGKHSVDPRRIYLFGARQGGEIACLFAFRNPGKVAGAVQANSYWNRFDYNDDDQLTTASVSEVKLCLVHGKEDPFFGKAQEAIESFTKAKIKSKLIEFDGGKELPEKDVFFGLLKDALAWLTE